jgi:hypothetical protein
MKKSGFRKQSLEEVKAKQAAKRATKRHKMPQDKSKGKKATKSPKKEKTQAWLKKELDRLFSIYIRKKYPAICYTCGKADTPLQCGHFVPRQYLATRWHEDNCRPQCVGCNIYGNGKILDFEEHLKRDLGETYVEELKATRHTSLKLDRHWYEEQIARYKALI